MIRTAISTMQCPNFITESNGFSPNKHFGTVSIVVEYHGLVNAQFGMKHAKFDR